MTNMLYCNIRKSYTVGRSERWF